MTIYCFNLSFSITHPLSVSYYYSRVGGVYFCPHPFILFLSLFITSSSISPPPKDNTDVLEAAGKLREKAWA